MSKVAINGRTLPLIPVAAGLAGVMALGAFMIMPQSVLEAMVWQTRLDTILPAAQPPLGGTARLLVAIAAAALAAGLTALLAWKFSGLTTPKKRRRRRGMGQSDILAAPVIAPASAESAASVAAPVNAPVVATADVADEEKIAAPKPSFLDRFRRKKVEEEDEIDLENMPNLRRRDFHPDAPARRPLFADAELPGKTLDSVEPVIDMSASATPAPTPFGSTPSAKYPIWAYEEKCDLSGQAARLAAESHAAPEAVAEPVVEPVASATKPAAETGDQPSFTHAPGSAGTADWDDPSAFDQYMESQAEEARERELEDQLEAASLETGPVEQQVETQPEPQPMPAPDVYAEPVAFAPEPVLDARPVILNPAVEAPGSEMPMPEMPAPEMPVFAEAPPTPALEPVEPDMPAAPVAAIPQAAAPEETQAQWLETELAKTEIGSASVDMLMARLEAGMARRATRREAQRVEAVRKAEQQAAAPAPQQEVLPPVAPAPVTPAPLAPMTGAETPAPQPAPAPSTNPFAAIDPLANLADKEAEVDEALRAALSTLERMNRRAG